jgi:hypothetical protein
MARKSKPWAVIATTPAGATTRTEHTSEARAYEVVRNLRDAINTGVFSATAIRVEQWERDCDRWVWFDQPYPEESQ